MGKRRNISIEEIHILREKFQSMIYYSQKCFGHNSFKRLKKNHYFNNKVHPITFEAVSLAVNNAIRKDYSFHEDTDYIKRYVSLLENEEFKAATTERTTNIITIRKRTELASRILFGHDYDW